MFQTTGKLLTFRLHNPVVTAWVASLLFREKRMKVLTYQLIENGNAIRCLVCLSESQNPSSVEELICPQCGVKHEELAKRIEKAQRTSWKVEQAARTLRRAGR